MTREAIGLGAADRSKRGWRRTLLGDLCKTTSGGTPSRKRADFFSGSIPWVKSGELTDGMVSDVEEFITEEAIANSSAKIFPPGTLLIALYGATVGKLGILSVGAATNQAVCAIFPPSDLDTKFLFWYMRYRRSDLVAQAVGGAQPNISQSILRTLDVPLPPLDEQHRIVAEIEKQSSRLDEAVSNLKRVKANLKRYKASVLQAAVDGRLEAEVETDADSPKNWDRVTCGDVVDSIQAGASFKCVERPPRVGEVGVVKVSAVTWGTFDEDESKTCADAGRIKEGLLIRIGDFLFSRANTIELVGTCVIVRRVTKSLMLSDKILRFHLASTILPGWLLICLRSRFGRSEIERLATGNQQSMRNIGQERIQQIRLPLPPLAEQHRIVGEVDRRLSFVSELEPALDAGIARARSLRNATLDTAFSGDSAAAGARRGLLCR